jgi:hypothetical protein
MVCLAGSAVRAVSITDGNQDFTDGQFVGSGTFLSASADELPPFHDFNGSGDAAGPNFTASWTFTYPLGSLIVAPTITIGILDHDSMASGNQVAFFGFDGNDMTTLLNSAFEGRGGANGQYNVYTVSIPAADFPSLADGSATFTLTLQGPGLGITGETSFNGAGLDFSTLDTVPEPSTWALLTAALGAGLLFRRRIS